MLLSAIPELFAFRWKRYWPGRLLTFQESDVTCKNTIMPLPTSHFLTAIESSQMRN